MKNDSIIAFRATGLVLGTLIDAISWDTAINKLLAWARSRQSRYVAICNAHLVVTASNNLAYREVINGADMATPDGAPVAWMLRKQGYRTQPRISGPDLMWKLCERAQDENLSIYCFGSTATTLSLLNDALIRSFPRLQFTMESPAFRDLTPEEDEEVVQRINMSGASIVFVGLGCPKQERWMAEHRGRIHAVMLGVGAAFDFHAGSVKRAPEWMRDYGLEWLHRLIAEPRRLWRRYLVTNTQFIIKAAKQLLTGCN